MKKIVTAILLLAVIPALFGQGAKYIIRNYDLLNEINLNGSTWSMIQDSSGVLYFGADYGVAVYNGAFWEMASGSQTIIRSLYYDSHHRIAYGGFNDFGYLEPNISRGIIFHSLTGQLPDSLKAFGDIWSICEAGDKLFFQSKSLIFVSEKGKVSAFRVKDCYHRGFLIGNSYMVNQKGIGLTVFDGHSFKPVTGGSFFGDQLISCVLETTDHTILIGCRHSGFWRFNPKTGSVSDPFPGYPSTNRELSENKVYHGILLPDGNLAAATLRGGTFLLSPSGKILKVLNRNHGLRDNVNYFLGLSYDSNLWVCTSNGISACNINSPFILWDYTSGIDGVVLDILDSENRVLIGTLTGLYEICRDQNSGPFTQQGATCLLNAEVWSLIKLVMAGQTLIFFGSGNGLYQLQGSVPELIYPGDLILKLLHLRSDQDVLIALHADYLDVFRWNGSTFQFERKIADQFNGLRTAAEDKKGNLWIGTRNSDVVQISVSRILDHREAAGQQDNGLVSDKQSGRYSFGSGLTDVIEYEGQVVFSNRNGIHSYDYSTGNFVKCQLFGPEISDTRRMISTLKKDSRGNIWIGGEAILLARPDGTYTFDKLNFQQLKDVFSAFVFLHSDDQQTWIGGNNGVYLFDNQVTPKLPAHLNAIINRIEVPLDTTLYLNMATSGQPGHRSPSGKPGDPLQIDLAKRNSQVTIYYSLPFFENERSTMFSYKLEGYLDEWSPWSGETNVTFSNLRPSEYYFQVQGRTLYNQVSQPAGIRFVVPRPWYLSNFVIATGVLFLAIFLYLAAKYLSRVSIRKHLRIEDIIRKRIQESNRSQILNLLSANSGHLTEQDALAGLVKQNTANHPVVETRENQFLVKALKIMESHMGNHNLTAGMFCREMGMSQAKVYRTLISLTGMSINQFIRNIRLKKAAQLLVETDLPISEIAYDTGFANPGYFTKCFSAEFGQNPRDFSQKKHHGRKSQIVD